MTKKITKTIALALAAITLSMPLSTTALAAGHDSSRRSHHKIEHRHDQRDHRTYKARAANHKYEQRHKKAKYTKAPARHQYKEHHSATGNFVTGTIVGAVIGAIIAKNT